MPGIGCPSGVQQRLWIGLHPSGVVVQCCELNPCMHLFFLFLSPPTLNFLPRIPNSVFAYPLFYAPSNLQASPLPSRTVDWFSFPMMKNGSLSSALVLASDGWTVLTSARGI